MAYDAPSPTKKRTSKAVRPSQQKATPSSKAIVPVKPNLPEDRYAYRGKLYKIQDEIADIGRNNAEWEDYFDEHERQDYPVAQDRRGLTITDKLGGARQDYYADIVDYEGGAKSRVKVGTNRTPSKVSYKKRKLEDIDEAIFDADFEDIRDSPQFRKAPNKNARDLPLPKRTPSTRNIQEPVKSQINDLSTPKTDVTNPTQLVSAGKRVSPESLATPSQRARNAQKEYQDPIETIYEGIAGVAGGVAGGIKTGIIAGIKGFKEINDAVRSKDKDKEKETVKADAQPTKKQLNHAGQNRLCELEVRLDYYQRYGEPHPTMGHVYDNEERLQKKIDHLLNGDAGTGYYTTHPENYLSCNHKTSSVSGFGGKVIRKDAVFGGGYYGFGVNAVRKDYSALTIPYSTKNAGGSIMGTAKGSKYAAGTIMGQNSGRKDAAGSIIGNSNRNGYYGTGKDATGSIMGTGTGRSPIDGMNLMKTNSNVVTGSSGAGTKNAQGSIVGNKKIASTAGLFSSNKQTVQATAPAYVPETPIYDPAYDPVYVPEQQYGSINDTRPATRSKIYKRRLGGVHVESLAVTPLHLNKRKGSLANDEVQITPSKLNKTRTEKVGSEPTEATKSRLYKKKSVKVRTKKRDATPSKLKTKKKQATPSKILSKAGTSPKVMSAGILRRLGEIGTTGSTHGIVSDAKLATPSKLITKRIGGNA